LVDGKNAVDAGAGVSKLSSTQLRPTLRLTEI
jgi:hypothetical protein